MKSIWEKILLEKIEAAHYQRKGMYIFSSVFQNMAYLI